MRILPLAFDSLGTRGMATFVETADIKILIDPGVALAPNRNGYTPHPIELQRMGEQWKDIVAHAKKCDVLILTHYHFDHHDPEHPEIYSGKTVLVKHPTESTNKSGAARAKEFLPKLKPAKMEYADGKSFHFGKTKIEFSKAVFHGTNNKLGYVVEVLVDDGAERLVHTSDVEGPAIPDQVDFILKHKPHYVICDGPMTYMLGYRYSLEHFEAAKANLLRILKECPIKRLILDHHLLRDKAWREKLSDILIFGGNKVCCAAEFLGKEEDVLENRRKELFRELPAPGNPANSME
jgi:predicted metallo-beta-lactamase superfamily hydrolase